MKVSLQLQKSIDAFNKACYETEMIHKFIMQSNLEYKSMLTTLIDANKIAIDKSKKFLLNA